MTDQNTSHIIDTTLTEQRDKETMDTAHDNQRPTRTIPPRPAPAPSTFWHSLGEARIVREWRIVRDSLFMVSSFPIALFAFCVASIGFTAGAGLTLLMGLGIPVLALTWAVLMGTLRFERARLEGLLGLRIPEPRTWERTRGTLLQRAFGYFTDPQNIRSLVYLGVMFPLGIVELALVSIPGEFLISPLVVMLGGEIQTDLLWLWTISNGFEAMIAFVIGLILLAPFSALINIATKLHIRLAATMLTDGRRTVRSSQVPTSPIEPASM